MTHIDAIVPYLFGRFDPRFDTTRLVPHSWVTEHVEKMGCKSSFMFSFCSEQVTFLVLGSDKVWSQKMIALLVAGRRKVQLEPRRSNTHWISISHRRGTYCRVSITLGHGAPTVGSTQFAVEHPPFVFVCFSSQQNNLGWRLCMFLFPDSLCWGIMAGHPILMLLTMRADMMDLSLPTVPMATLLHIPTILTPGLQAMALFTHRATPPMATHLLAIRRLVTHHLGIRLQPTLPLAMRIHPPSLMAKPRRNRTREGSAESNTTKGRSSSPCRRSCLESQALAWLYLFFDRHGDFWCPHWLTVNLPFAESTGNTFIFWGGPVKQIQVSA